MGNVLVNHEGDGSGWSDSQQTWQQAFVKASRPFKPRRVQERVVVTPSTQMTLSPINKLWWSLSVSTESEFP